MNGLDRGKAADPPSQDGLGMAQHDSPWRGQEPGAPVAPDAAPLPNAAALADGDAMAMAAPEPVAAESATPPEGSGPPEPATPAQPGPWHASRPRRGTVQRHAGQSGTAARLHRVLGAIGFSRLNLARLNLAHLNRSSLNQSSLPRADARRLALTGAAVLTLAWLAGTSLHRVGPGEQAIVATAGAWGPVQGPGLVLSWPWPLGTVRIENVAAVRHLALPDGAAENLMLTRDGALVDLAWDLRWHVVDLRRHALALADPATALPLAAEAAMRGTVAGMDLAEIAGIGAGAGAGGDADAGAGADSRAAAPGLMANRAAQRLQAMFDRDGAGIVIDGIDLRRIGPPARVADAWRAVAAARSDAANEAVQAQSWARQTIVRAQGDAAAFDKVRELYRQAPDVTRRQIYYATMERVLGQSDKVIVDAPGTVIQMPQPTPAPNAPQTVQAPAAPQPGAKVGNGH